MVVLLLEVQVVYAVSRMERTVRTLNKRARTHAHTQLLSTLHKRVWTVRGQGRESIELGNKSDTLNC